MVIRLYFMTSKWIEDNLKVYISNLVFFARMESKNTFDGGHFNADLVS